MASQHSSAASLQLAAGLLDQYTIIPRFPAPVDPDYHQGSSLASSSSSPHPTPNLLTAPSKGLKASLLAIPALTRNNKMDRKKKNKIIAKVYNPQASRPLPTLTSPLTQIAVTLQASNSFVSTSLSAPVFASSSVTLASFPAFSAYTGLFDEYKIESIEAWLDPNVTMSSTAASTMFASAVDLDDANTPLVFSDVSERQGAILSDSGTGHYHRWRPYVANALFSGAFTSYGSEPAPWIDCASPSVQHYGLKVATSANDGAARVYALTVRALVSFRGCAI